MVIVVLFLRDFCETSSFLKVIWFIKELLGYVFVLVPIGLIIMLSVDFAKNVIAGREDDMKKNLNVAIKRLIMSVIIFFIPTVVSVVMSLVDDSGLLISMKFDVYYDCIENANKEEIDRIVLEEKEEKQGEQENRVDVYVPDIDTSNSDYGTSSLGNVDSLLSAADNVWNTIVNGDKYFTYNANTYHQIPITGSQCDCSSLVSWILYEAGYEDFEGKQRKTWELYDTDWNELYGWEEISISKGENITDKVKPGDVVVRVPINNGKAGSGHVNFVARVEGKDIYVYDCGSSGLVKNGVYSNGIKSSWFFKGENGNARHAGKIIRVAK